MRYLFMACVLATCVGCGSNTPTQPSTVQVGGVWTGTATQTSASGGPECLGLFQQSNGGSDRISVSITQTGSSLQATSTSQTTGQSCSYTGSAGNSSITLNATSCQPPGYQVTCNFVPRDVILGTLSATATVSGNSITGTTGQTWNVFQRGTTTNGLGLVVVNNSFSLTRQ